MRITAGTLLACAFLAGCGDPLDRVGKLSDETLGPNGMTREVAASPEEVQRAEGAVFGGLFRRSRAEPVAPDVPDVPDVPEALATEAVVTADTETGVDGDVVQPEAVAVAVPEDAPARRGLLGIFRRADQAPASDIAVDAAVAEALEPEGAIETTEIAESEVVSQAEPVQTAALEPAPEPEKRRGLLGLFARADDGDVQEVVTRAAPLEEAVAEEIAPLAEPEKVASTEALDAAEPAPEPEKRRGLLGLFAREDKVEDVVAADPVDAPAESVDPAAVAAAVTEAEAEPEAEPVATALATAAPDEAAQPVKRGGVFGGLFRARNAQDAPKVEAEVEVASLDPALPEASEPVVRAEPEQAKARGIFARREAPRKGPDAADVTLGTMLPFGEVARVCEAKKADLGKRIETAGRGNKGFALYDSAPETTTPRAFYVTGFSDGCPRQFTAALALFGAPEMHEQLRYGRPSEKYPYSTTDKAYEKVKAAICKAAKRKPCGAKMETLERNTVFISTYERFTDNGRWADILLHDGTVLAAAVKDL